MKMLFQVHLAGDHIEVVSVYIPSHEGFSEVFLYVLYIPYIYSPWQALFFELF